MIFILRLKIAKHTLRFKILYLELIHPGHKYKYTHIYMGMKKTCNHHRDHPWAQHSQALNTQLTHDKSCDTPAAIQAPWAMPSIINC